MKNISEDNFKFDGNGRKFSKWVENTVGKMRNCEHVFPFPNVFSKDFYSIYVKTRTCL